MSLEIRRAPSDVQQESEPAIRAFERAWGAGAHPEIDDFLDGHRPGTSWLLRELVHIDLEFRLGAGEPARVEDYLRRYPCLEGDRAALASLIESERRLRRRSEAGLSDEEYLERFGPILRDLNVAFPHGDSTTIELGRETDRGEIEAEERDLPRPFGKFSLLEVVGRGGFGIVYRAQEVELGRNVAVKLPRYACLSHDEEQRFLREARSVARLRHPNIVALFEAGRIDGRPYLASEFIAGMTLAERLRTGRPDARQAAELAAAVAEALEAAHQQRIIHRDVKPTNILLDGAGRPHVADFGLAKHQAGEASLTLDGQLLGTPAYMAPEQAREEAIDARTDVYGLGVVLYEMLVGEPPFQGSARMVLWQLLEHDPRPPRTVNASVPRDLEAICVKAMAKSPAQRYPTAQALADDLRRYLRGEPVTARLVGPVDRLARWCRRNPRLAAAVGLAATSLILATGLSLVLAWVQYHAAAKLHAEQARTLTEQARTLAEKARVEYNLRRTMGVLDEFLASVGGNAGAIFAEQQGSVHLRGLAKRSLDTVIKGYEELLSQHGDNPELQSQLAYTLERLGWLERTGGSHAESLAAYQRALAIRQRLARDHPESVDFRWAVAQLHSRIGSTLRSLGRPSEALRAYEQFSSITDDVCKIKLLEYNQKCETGSAYLEIGSILREAGRVPSALHAYRKGRDVLEELTGARPSEDFEARKYHVGLGSDGWNSFLVRDTLAHTYSQIGVVLDALDRPAEALHSHERALATWKALARDRPTDPDYQADIPYCLSKIGLSLRGAGRAAEARRTLQRACQKWEELVRDTPSPPVKFRANQAASLLHLGWVSQELGRDAETLVCLERGHDLYKELSLAHFQAYWCRECLALCLVSIGRLRRESGRPTEAMQSLRQARTIFESFPQPSPLDQYSLACCLAQMIPILAEDRDRSVAADVREYGDLAMARLRLAVAGYFRSPYIYRTDPNLNPIRERDDFRMLLMDLSLPEDPFASAFLEGLEKSIDEIGGRRIDRVLLSDGAVE